MQAMNPDSVPGKIERALRDPEVKRALDLAADMALARRSFSTAAGARPTSSTCSSSSARRMRYGPAIAHAEGRGQRSVAATLQQKALVSALCEERALLKAPDLVLGFRVKNLELARRELDRLENVATCPGRQAGATRALKRATVDGHDYLTLLVDGGMIPWDAGRGRDSCGSWKASPATPINSSPG